ncbi:MAG TPA: DUF2249 domain-containing protein [Opitutaceae bacterium]|nr:DUF2249 domain-containing protein [Opitutaceae bacterium]
MSTPSLDSAATLDVRPLAGRIKHATIFQRWFDLPVGAHFVLVNDHDPVPLKYQFDAEYTGAFTWEYLERGPEEFRVKITKRKAVVAHAPQFPPRRPDAAPAPAPAAATNGVQEIDCRGLEPPEPLIRILDALESLPAGRTLRAHTDREPCHLFGEAEQRGFRHESHEQPDGSWITVLVRG